MKLQVTNPNYRLWSMLGIRCLKGDVVSVKDEHGVMLVNGGAAVEVHGLTKCKQVKGKTISNKKISKTKTKVAAQSPPQPAEESAGVASTTEA